MKRKRDDIPDPDPLDIIEHMNRTLARLFRDASPLDASGKPKRWRNGADEALDLINKRMED